MGAVQTTHFLALFHLVPPRPCHGKKLQLRQIYHLQNFHMELYHSVLLVLKIGHIKKSFSEKCQILIPDFTLHAKKNMVEIPSTVSIQKSISYSGEIFTIELFIGPYSALFHILYKM